MAEKIMYLHASPRKKGNTAAVSVLVLEAAKASGAEIYEVDVTSLKAKTPGCIGCMKCQQSEAFSCTIDDQLAEIVSSLPDYDCIVLATPVYWMSYPAQAKMLVDRMVSLMKFTKEGTIETPLAGRTLALLATGNSGLENNLDLLQRQWKNTATMLSCRFKSCLFPEVPRELGALARDQQVVQKAKDFGAGLVS